VSWDLPAANTRITEAVVHLKNAKSHESTIVRSSGEAPCCKLTGLLADTRYFVQVVLKNAVSESDRSKAEAFATDLSTPFRGIQFTQTSLESMLVETNRKLNELPQANVLVFGGAGTGKSSMINAIDTLIQNSQTVSCLLNTGTQKTRVTTHLYKYSLPNTSLSIWDVPGWEPTLYQGPEMSDLIRGHLDHNSDLVGYQGASSKKWISNPQFHQRVHVVCLVLPCDMIDVSDKGVGLKSGYEETLTTFTRFMRSVPEEGYKLRPLLIITKSDLIYGQEGVSSLFVSRHVRSLVNFLCTKFGFTQGNIIFTKAYNDEQFRNVTVDSLNAAALLTIIELCSAVFQTRPVRPTPAHVPAVPVPAVPLPAVPLPAVPLPAIPAAPETPSIEFLVRVEQEENNRGFVDVPQSATLDQLRHMIRDEIEGLGDNFEFLSIGVPVNRNEERTTPFSLVRQNLVLRTDQRQRIPPTFDLIFEGNPESRGSISVNHMTTLAEVRQTIELRHPTLRFVFLREVSGQLSAVSANQEQRYRVIDPNLRRPYILRNTQ
jgi:hypothetical protein